MRRLRSWVLGLVFIWAMLGSWHEVIHHHDPLHPSDCPIYFLAQMPVLAGQSGFVITLVWLFIPFSIPIERLFYTLSVIPTSRAPPLC